MTSAFVAIGGNLISSGYDTLGDVMADAITHLACDAVEIVRCSPWYETAPVPISDQPWFLNAVLEVKTALSDVELLAYLHEVESNFGRVRNVRNEARILDLDLIDYKGQVREDEAITLPHPRMHLRAFVLLPLRDLYPAWRHPVSGRLIDDLIANMPEGQDIRLKS